ncbi:glycoside hydrolase [Thozetella sp. PMI_491]|nr:glycoside hydrolase [Thozetella sp. PMI_491]
MVKFTRRRACLGIFTWWGAGGIAKAANIPASLAFQGPTLTSKWIEGSDHVQIIELVVHNTDTANAFTSTHNLTISASSSSVDLVKAATINRLFPNQYTVVQVGVKNKANTIAGTACSVTLTATWALTHSVSTTFSGTCGFGDYTTDTKSLSWHWTPDWYNNAKFGIFSHWGIYSVPAYGNIGANEDYAEWYWMRQHQPDFRSQTYEYHENTYGTKLNYDDFLVNFTASKFDPVEWLDLIEASGARYYVPVTKHHDGFALFNTPTNSSLRNSVHYGPKRDFVKELLDTAKASYPNIRRGTYFSLPEWYHPEYAKYGITWGGGFPGGPPTNPYTNETIPYTGYVPVDDFVMDLQLPEMNTLAYEYETEIMWCDIGGANNSTLFASAWLNWARDKNRQVTFNDRCGIPGDFSTPEYTTNAGLVVPKWESNRGMDPFSFGYNYMTPDSGYLTGEDVVQSLVDIVSKGGNFLLDVGPKADGTIPDIMQKGLRDAGLWIHSHAESIFDTRFWWNNGPGLDPFRYTLTDDAFYIHVNSRPGNSLHISDKIPYLSGDSIVVVGGNSTGTEVPVKVNTDGSVNLTLSDEIIAGDKYVWTFKIVYSS